MKLCFICYEYPPGPHGGVGTFTRLVGRALVAAGHRVRVVGLYPPSYPAPDRESDEGVEVWRIREGSHRLGWVEARYRQYRLVRQWIAAGDIDLVEAPDCYGWFAGWPRLPVPLVARAHGSLTYYAHELGRSVARTGHTLERWSYRRTDAWVAVSRHAGEVTRRLFGLRRGPDAVLYDPVVLPPGTLRATPRRQGLVVFSGTLTAKKGILSLIAAWPAVAARVPGARLAIYGKDQRTAAGDSIQAELLARLPGSVRDTVEFHGHVSRECLLAALTTASAAVFPSYTETFGFGAVEALAAGCPTIYTRRSCGPEIVRDEVDGLLVDPDRPEQIARAIERVLTEPELARRLRQAGPARVAEAFALEPLVEANERFFGGQVATFRGAGRVRGG